MDVSEYEKQLTDFVAATKTYADAVRKLHASAPLEESPAYDAAAHVAVTTSRAILLEALSACPHMRVVFVVPPLALHACASLSASTLPA
jgi:hypothetical protein